MTEDQIKQLIESAIEGAQVTVKLEGANVQLTVVSEAFAGLRSIKKQQMVYAAIQEQIADGSLHAVNMQTFTPEEWEKAQRFQIG